MAQADTLRQPLIKTEYEPVSSSRKLHLLLQRSVRYSYRQRCCNCCPTILCELLFPLILIILLVLTRYGVTKLAEQTSTDDGSLPGTFNRYPCSRNLSVPPTSSKDMLVNCFKFPPSYAGRRFGSLFPSTVSNYTTMVFQPDRADVRELVVRAGIRLADMNCNQRANVSSKDRDDTADAQLLQNEAVNTVIIDFSATSDLKKGRNLAYNIIARTPNTFPKNDPIDISFLTYKHPGYISDRSNSTDNTGKQGSELPEFTDVKMFVDSLLMEYQSNRPVQYELERNLMTCTPYREDYFYTADASFVNTILLMIDGVFIIPFLILLTSLIREKNAKVKEILKVLGIEPILNNIAQAIRTMIILVILIVFLCIAYKIKFKGEAYFNTVNFGVLFFGYLVYALQLVAFCITNAQLFNTNVRAIVFTFVIYLITNSTYSLILTWPVGIQYILIFLCPYVGVRSLFQQAVLYDLAKKDVAVFETAYRHVPVYFSTLIVMIFSCLFYWALSWYLEKVFPGEYGVPFEWNFLFKREYWRRATSRKAQVYSYDRHASVLTTPSSTLTRSNSTGTPVVHVDHLVKKFGPDKIAVNDVSFDLYENQITSLLGPNGSGKTTIFNCLIGIYKQTSGTITMDRDNDTTSNIDMLRKAIGYCPQHDILFDLLTVEEQLQFYASARGFAKSKQQISNDILRLVNLETAKDAYCNALSGGMKRRLSLACAFVGDTKIILLDEPSSGLDPSNRRLLWDWLRTMKEGKTLLLTTHFMEESDALSDRIMIIANGVIKADGTSAKLKEQHGSGYKLVVNKESNYGTHEIEGQLRGYLPHLTVEADIIGGDVVFRTNQQPDDKFVQALRQLEIMKSKNLIKTYGVQNSTMDDVFLKITRDAKDGNDTGSTAIDMERIGEQCDQVFNSGHFFLGHMYYLSQLYGLLIKTFLVRYRRWGLTLLVLLLPIVYNLLSNIISQTQNASGTYKMQTTSLNPQTILYAADPAFDNYFQAAAGDKSSQLKFEKRTDDIPAMNRYIWQKRMDRPSTYSDIFLGFRVPAPEGNTYKIQALSSNLIAGHEVVSVGSNLFYKYAMNDSGASIQSTLIYKKTGNLTFEPTVGGALSVLSLVSCFIKLLPLSLILDLFVFYLIFLYAAVFLAGERGDNFLTLLNISGLHPAFYWLFNYVFDVITSVVWFCYLLAIYCIIDVAFNGSPNSQSTSPSAIPLEFATPWDLRVQFYPLTIIIVLPTLPFAYLITKIIRSDILCGLAVMFILVLLHLVSVIVPIIMALVNNTLAQKLAYWILNIISPSINAQAIVTYILAQKSRYCQVIASQFAFFKPIGDDTMAWNWAILVLHVVLLLLLLIAIDSGLIKPSALLSWLSSQTPFDENTLDSDVRAERHRILSLNQAAATQPYTGASNIEVVEPEADHLVVHDLVKRFRGRALPAVNHLTFGAKRGEAFGLLGYNGAGKTTTFRILVGDETATQGTAFIDGQNVSRRLRSLRHLGYCPQQDCSMDFLTVQDGLYLLARIRGVPFARIHGVVQTISSLFLLDPFLQNYIHQLSGGTKRRLHAAMALIGPPLVAILDEPTTGVDPNARQQMQEIFLNAVKAKLTIVLTSHSMDECERVCNRLGIMVQGQLACLGTIQHLKSKFGQGYTLEVKVRSIPGDTQATAIENMQAFLLSRTQFSMQVMEKTYSTGSFQVKQGTPADLFELLEQNRQQLSIETYTISQTTLEQIFLSFGKQGNAVQK